MLFENQEVSLEFNCSLPRRNPERAGSIHHTPLPTPSMHSPSFPPVPPEEKWARTYSGPGCSFHSLRFQPLGYTGVWAGLQKGRFCSRFLAWRGHLWKDGCWQIYVHPSRWVRTGQKEWSVEMEDLGSVMYNVQSLHLPLSSFCLCVSVCSVTQSVLTLWGSMDCSPPVSSVLLVSAQGK